MSDLTDEDKARYVVIGRKPSDTVVIFKKTAFRAAARMARIDQGWTAEAVISQCEGCN